MISAGLWFGQYVSQYTVRMIVSKNRSQAKRSSQLLLGVNDKYAARKMHLKVNVWQGKKGAQSFLSWIENQVHAGHPVIIGVYENFALFEGVESITRGDPEYDHIVPVIRVFKRRADTNKIRGGTDDVITISDNGLWSPGGTPKYLYDYTFDSFPATRSEANNSKAGVYSLPLAVRNYGVAITGVIDEDGLALPVHVTTDTNYEAPQMTDGSTTPPPPQKVTLTISLENLKKDADYMLYRYDRMDEVPNGSFNRHRMQASRSWKIRINSGSTFTLRENILSSQTAVYRAVPETAP